MKQLLSVSSAGPMLSEHILSIGRSFSLCLHLGLASYPLCLCRSPTVTPLSPLTLPPFPLPLPLLHRDPLSPPVRDRLPALVLVVLRVRRSVGNKLSTAFFFSEPGQDKKNGDTGCPHFNVQAHGLSKPSSDSARPSESASEPARPSGPLDIERFIFKL